MCRVPCSTTPHAGFFCTRKIILGVESFKSGKKMVNDVHLCELILAPNLIHHGQIHAFAVASVHVHHKYLGEKDSKGVFLGLIVNDLAFFG